MVDESATTTADDETAKLDTSSTKKLHCCYPRCCGQPLYHGNGEALGWGLDAVARAVSYMGAAVFLGTALLKLAKEAAGCATEPLADGHVPPCENRVYGIRPSSLLTGYTMIVGLVTASFLPLMGAIVDFTPHRRLVGRIMSVIFCALLFPQIFVNQHTWFAVTIIQFFIAFTGWGQSVIAYAYLPDLTDSEERLNGYTQSFTLLSFGSIAVYLAAVVAIAQATGNGQDSEWIARLGQSVSFVVSSISLYLAWGPLLQTRPAMRELPQGRSLVTAGFVQVFSTSKHIYKELPSLGWLLISVAFSDAGVNALATISITFLTDTLAFTTQQNGVAIMIMLVCSLPGALISGVVTRWYNAKTSAILASVILTVNTIVAGLVLQEPGQEIRAYCMAVGWGIGTGWRWTIDRLLISAITPPGQDTELMGVYLFAGQVLTWLPPLIFTVINEAGLHQRWGVGAVSISFFLGLVALLCMGNYRAAVEAAGRMGSKSNPGDKKEQPGVYLDETTAERSESSINKTSEII